MGRAGLVLLECLGDVGGRRRSESRPPFVVCCDTAPSLPRRSQKSWLRSRPSCRARSAPTRPRAAKVRGRSRTWRRRFRRLAARAPTCTLQQNTRSRLLRAPSRARAPACSHGGAGRRTEAGRLRHRAAAPRRGRRRRPHDAPVGRAAVQELCQAQLEGASGHPARARGRRHARSRARLPAPSPCRPLTCRAARPLAVPPSSRRARRRMTATCRSPRATARRSRPTWCT